MTDAELGFEAEPPHDDKALGFEPEPQPGLGTIGMRVAGKVLDYPGGVVRGAMGSLLQTLGGPKVITADELKAALSPLTTQRAPGMGKMMERAGIPPGPALSDYTNSALAPRWMHSIYSKPGTTHPSIQPEVGGDFDPTARGAVGAVADSGTDPLSWLSGPEALTKIVSKPVALTSEAMHQSAIRPIIQAGERYGNPNVGKTMLQEGIWGSPPAIQSGMEAAAGKFKAGRDAILDAADAAGAGASKDNALAPMFNQLMQLVKDQRLTPDQASKILSDLTAAKQAGGDLVPTQLMSQWKTDTAHALPGATFDELSKTTPSLANQVKETARAGYQHEGEAAVGRALGPAQQDSLVELNRSLGNMINPHVEGAAATMASKYERQPWISKEDLYSSLLGMGAFNAGGVSASHTLEGGLMGLAAKKAINASQAVSTRTGLGLAGSRAMRTPVIAKPLDAAARQALIRRFSPYDEQSNYRMDPSNSFSGK